VAYTEDLSGWSSLQRKSWKSCTVRHGSTPSAKEET